MIEKLKPREGYIFDYISGEEIKGTPEEVEAVQPFSIQLVEDYGYPKNVLQTRPQFRVKASPSDTRKKYPVDIAIFKTNSRKDDEVFIIVECKKKTRKDGKTQLKDYLRLSKAELGVWFNGDQRLFIKKIERNGKVLFEEIPNIPKYGQRLEDIGKFKRKDLKVPNNLKLIFKAIRNHLAGNFTGATRDEELAKELINLIFCKIYDEKFTRPDDIVSFRIGLDEDKKVVKERIFDIFKKVKTKYKAVIDISDTINLDENAIAYVTGELQNYTLVESERDVIAEAFETFIGYALKGAQGQFFTPRNIVKLLVEVVKPQPDELVIDPACGSGGFLVESLRYMWKELDRQAINFNWSDLALNEEKIATAIHKIRGVEKDSFLSKVAKAYMAILGDGKGGIFCENSLERPSEWQLKTRQSINLGQFDVLLANPPFGKDIKVEGSDILNQYDLGYKWTASGNSYQKTNKLKGVETPQIIFIERCLQLLKQGGRLGIVLPETFFHAPRSRYVLHKMLEGNNLKWVMDLPHNTFRPHNNAKCLALVIEKGTTQQRNINMAVLEQIGHDHQGKDIFRWDLHTKKIDRNKIWDDTPLVIDEINNGFSKYCFQIDARVARSKNIYVPRYYWENRMEEIKQVAEKQNLQLVSIKTLIDKKIIKWFDGHGSPAAEYKGRGNVSYIRVKDIVNWEMYKDPTSRIPEEIYLAKKGRNKDLEKCDVVYVRRGSYRIGSVAMVSPFDIKSLLTREILVLRIIKEDNEYGLNAYYLLYLLSHFLTQEQSFNKILIETTLPNIASRWQELMLPIATDESVRNSISERIKNVINDKWSAVERLENLKKDLGDLTT